MPRLVCRTCGRRIYTVAPIESLFAEERRCPRCGANLNADRRGDERRQDLRRANPADEPGPSTETGERRTAERRTAKRRRPADGENRPTTDSEGWQD
jgi:hypothetical protein